jgi:hypothetical protein
MLGVAGSRLRIADIVPGGDVRDDTAPLAGVESCSASSYQGAPNGSSLDSATGGRPASSRAEATQQAIAFWVVIYKLGVSHPYWLIQG